MQYRIVSFMIAGTLIFSQELAQDILNELSKQPYATVSPLIARMQNEAAHQPVSAPGAPQAPSMTTTTPDNKKE